MSANHAKSEKSGILLIDKTSGCTSFKIVSILRKITFVKKIGHAGTLDPFATGVMVMLIGKEYTKRSDELLNSDKTYRATLKLGSATDTFDLDGQTTDESSKVPTLEEIEKAIHSFQGVQFQVPPMYSAKKIGGKKLCDLARQGVVLERAPVQVHIEIQLLNSSYPFLELEITCSKGTYIRSLAHDLGTTLQSFAHLVKLSRIRSGSFHLKDCIPQHLLQSGFDVAPYLRTL